MALKKIDQKEIEKKISRGTRFSYLFKNYEFDEDYIEELIEKYPAKFDNLRDRGVWTNLFVNHQMSEQFIEKHKSKFNDITRAVILTHQDLSDDFLERNNEMFGNPSLHPISEILKWGKFTPQFVYKYIDRYHKHNLLYLLQNNKRINQKDFEPLYVALELS